jgi:predicted 3-demethylubiquinone-9 3-methyltransferase (glyoxalase superfamily)
MANVQKITPNLWFDTQAEEAATFYTSVFKNSGIGRISHYGKEGKEIHGMPEGTVMTVEFFLEGQQFTALNGGPVFKFNEAISLVANCDTQQEVDSFWDKLSAGGDKSAQQCGWLKDKFGLSWQVTPGILPEMLVDEDPERSQRVFKAMLKMKKLDIRELKRAYEGKTLVEQES